MFHAEIVVDNALVAAESRQYQKIPNVTSFCDGGGTDRMQEAIQDNYKKVKSDIVFIIESELTRIENDPELQHLKVEK